MSSDESRPEDGVAETDANPAEEIPTQTTSESTPAPPVIEAFVAETPLPADVSVSATTEVPHTEAIEAVASSEAVAAASVPETADVPTGEDAVADTPATDTPASSQPVAETPTPETNATPPASEPAAEATQAAPAEPAAANDEPKRRVRLNPTVDSNTTKAVSSLEATNTPSEPAAVAAPAGEATASDEAVSEAEAAAQKVEAARVKAAPPVDLPPAKQSLDAEMEAEIEAALTSGELDAANAIPAMTTEAVSDEVEVTPAAPLTEETIEEGMRLTGKIQSIHGDDVFLDLGVRSPGVVQARQFTSGKKPLVGQAIEVVVAKIDEEEGLVQLNLPSGMRKVSNDWESLAAGQTVDCVVTKSNKGGLEVTVGSLRGFMPAGQVDLMFVSELDSFIGQQLRAQIVEANARKRNLVVSRRAHLMEERKEAEAELWKTIKVGQNHPGKVKTLKDYGAFIDIGGADGFLHIGEISWSRINKPSDVLQVGQEVEVQIISLDPEKKKIGLGMRQLVTNPWSAVTMNYPAESTVAGKVTRIADFGAFVELEPGVEGLVHISEIDYARVHRVADALKVGQEIEAKVTSVDPDKRRIGLSIKALKSKPEVKGKKKSDADLAPGGGEAYERKHKGPLKGGMGSSSGSLFGNPADYS